MPTELITLEFLSSLAGMAVAVTLVVSFIKWLGGLTGRKAKVAAWITALILVAVVYANQGLFAVTGLTAIGTILVMWILNSMLVTWTAMKAYEDVVEPAKAYLQRDTEPPDPNVDPPHLKTHRHQDR